MEQPAFDPNLYDTIRKNIRQRRKAQRMTSAQLAETVGLSHDFIRQIQSNKAGYNFSVETFYKIAVALDVSMDELAGRQPPKPPEDSKETAPE